MSLRKFIVLSAALSSSIATTSPAAAASMSEIMRASYPKESLARGEQGTVSFAVDLDEDARIESCVVTNSSGYARLDSATCDLIVLHANFAPAVAETGNRVATTRTGRISWRLPSAYLSNASLAPAPTQISADELEKGRLYCRRTQAAGSLVRLKTHCLTKDEWMVAESAVREGMEQLISRTRNRQ